MKFRKLLPFFLFFFAFTQVLHAYWVWSPEQGKFINPEGAAEDSADEEFNRAMKLYKDKNLKEAAEKFTAIIKKNPNAKVAPEAQYRLGIINEELGEYLKAFRNYKTVVENYPGSERFNEVIEREYQIGNIFLSGKKGKFAGVEILPSAAQAAKVFEHIVKFAPFSEFGDKAQFQLGLTYKKQGQFSKAVEAFQGVVDQYPQSPLVPQARYQLAETAYKRSTAEFRNQTALDDAARQVDRYLTRYPDEQTSEEAAKIRQVIDEKNAEKNYRVGLYYEKENFLDSALIYYSDVSARYPHTQWGKKAAEKLKSLKAPADYLNNQEKEVLEQASVLKAQIKEAGDKDPEEKDRLKRKLERIEQKQKGLSKDKKESMSRRRQDLARRQHELKLKFKNLETKRKLLKKNPSEDLKRAIDRWHASLVEEQDALEEEKVQIKTWSQELGVPEKKLDLLPFLGEGSTPLEKVRQVEAKKLYKLSEEKKSLLDEKELLYKQHNEVATLLGRPAGASLNFSDETWEAATAKDETLKAQKEKVDAAGKNIELLEKELEGKTSQYRKNYGKDSWLSSGMEALGKSLDKSIDVINPFDGKKQLEDGHQEILERKMHVSEKLAAQQSIVQTLTEAFNAQLALQEQRRLLASIQGSGQTAPTREELAALRKQLKGLEKQIRADYQEIQDRHKEKSKMLDEMDSLLKQHEAKQSAMVRSGHLVAAPVVGAAKLGKAFLFGLPQKDVEITKTAQQLNATSEESSRMKQLSEQVQLNNLIIEAKSRDIASRQKQLEILRAKASLIGGYKFRPAFVKVPYLFIDEAIQSAKRMVPKKEREEMLINRINEETQKLEAMKAELAQLEKDVDAQPSVQAPAEKKAESVPVPAKEEKQPEALSEGQKEMKREIEALQEKIEAGRKDFSRRQEELGEKLEEVRKKFNIEEKKDRKQEKKAGKQEKKLRKELDEIELEIKQLIEKERKLELEESSVLEKRIRKIDDVMKRLHSRVLSQDLLTERERMESRLSQIESRKDFLTKEQERFRVAETGAART